MGLLHDLDDGKKREVSEEDYYYFLECLPPAAYGFTFNGEKWHFGFAEGYDYVYAFKQQGDKYYAQKTNYLKPEECGKTIQQQQADPSFVERYERSILRLFLKWTHVASRNMPNVIAMGEKRGFPPASNQPEYFASQE